MQHHRYAGTLPAMTDYVLRSVRTAANIALTSLPSGAARSPESQTALFLGVLEAAVRDIDPELADRVRLVSVDRRTPAAGA